jgi:hypothetical protein
VGDRSGSIGPSSATMHRSASCPISATISASRYSASSPVSICVSSLACVHEKFNSQFMKSSVCHRNFIIAGNSNRTDANATGQHRAWKDGVPPLRRFFVPPSYPFLTSLRTNWKLPVLERWLRRRNHPARVHLHLSKMEKRSRITSRCHPLHHLPTSQTRAPVPPKPRPRRHSSPPSPTDRPIRRFVSSLDNSAREAFKPSQLKLLQQMVLPHLPRIPHIPLFRP